jgi:hypothetical protein
MQEYKARVNKILYYFRYYEEWQNVHCHCTYDGCIFTVICYCSCKYGNCFKFYHGYEYKS